LEKNKMATKAKPTDVTGRKREAMVEANIDAMQDAANTMSMATAEARVKLETEVIDATKPDRQTVIVDEPTIISDDAEVVIRVVEDIENMTLGSGNNYNFKAGQKYKVTKHVAQHLQEKGYLAGVI
jgi:outer membrane translocation and assembly module TamA